MTKKQLVTVLAETEAVVNSHLLVYVDDDINSSIILTPADFLSFHTHHVFPNLMNDPDPEFEMEKRTESSQSLLQLWKKGQDCLNQLWSSWRDEYLLSLREKSMKGSNNRQVPTVEDLTLL